ncbi:MAG: hypothetical protein JSR55_10595 [Proteobacteria bacterium]|nr:hypothetical protein [Pseudomonadota bacterium]
MPGRPTALLLYALSGETAGTVGNHIRALETLEGFDCRSLNVAWQLPTRLDLERFDVVIVHYSLMASESTDGPISLSDESIARLGHARVVKCVFMQDEHRNVKQTIAALRALHADVFFTCMPEDIMAEVYPPSALPGINLVNVLTGYVDESLLTRKSRPFSERPIDVGYRARKVAYWLGKLAQDKWTIAERFARDTQDYSLVCDISTREQDRLYGTEWIEFLGSCKAVLGTESGASVVDLDGTIRQAVDAAVARNPTLTFEEAQARYFAEADGRFSMAQISPRCFEAAALKTLMILYEGEYSGRLEPYRHYVPLKKDHSNISDVVDILRNPARAQTIIETAYLECACAPRNSHRALQERVAQAIRIAVDDQMRAPAYGNLEWSTIEDDNRKILDRARRLRAANALLSRMIACALPGNGAVVLRDRIAKPLRIALLRR